MNELKRPDLRWLWRLNTTTPMNAVNYIEGLEEAVRTAYKHSNAKSLSWRSEKRGVNESNDVYWRNLPAVKLAMKARRGK